ncbi:MAG: acylphosphatase [Acidothermaceae bacterium]
MSSDAADFGASEPVRLTAWVRGRVQGVGFRWWVRARALELGLIGSASNLDDGRVEVIAEGDRAICERLLELLAGPSAASRPGAVTGVVERWSRPDATRPSPSGFVER